MTKAATPDATIGEIIRKNADARDLGETDDFFAAGISSLTVVNMQMEIEGTLKRAVATKDLMKNPTIAGWSSLYAAARQDLKQAS